MTVFRMKIAGQVAAVTAVFDSTAAYFRDYLTEDAPDFSVAITPADREFEQRASVEEALEEGIRPRVYTEPHLERAAIQRKFAEHLFDLGTLLVHGSTVALDGQAYLFTAKCGTGKSTHTRLWRQVFGTRAVMVNDDKPFLRLTDAGVYACGSPWAGKHGLGSNITVPLKGICILERGPENRIREISPEEAMEMLLHQSYCPLDEGKRSRFHSLVEQLAHRVPLWKMECTKDPAAAAVSCAAMSGTAVENLCQV